MSILLYGYETFVSFAGLLSTYTRLFELGDSLADIKTRSDLFDYLRMVSARARDLQPSSSTYLMEETGEVKLLAGASLTLCLCGEAALEV